MFAIEGVIAAIARRLGIDPLDVRKRNLYGEAPRNVTHYGMTVKDNVLPELIDELEIALRLPRRGAPRSRELERARTRSSRRAWRSRRSSSASPSPNVPMNQGGALVHIYTDGSVHLNHGGTEMGQGLMIKVAQIVADELAGRPLARAHHPDLDRQGAEHLAHRSLERHRHQRRGGARRLPRAERASRAVRARHPDHSLAQLARAAYNARVSLSATGYWSTPEIHFDRASFTGEPFYYFAYGAAVSEVVIDTLTGESRLLRADLLHDVGRSVNPAIDRGQVEGGFIQGMGWLTMEEVVWDAKGTLAHPRALDVQDPGGERLPAGVQHLAVGARRERARHRLPLQGGRRAAAHARALGVPRHHRRGRLDRRFARSRAARRAGHA